MTEPRRAPSKPKNVQYLTTTLSCKRCPTEWAVVDLNPELKVVKCPRCGEPNDIREAVGRAL
jgi:transcription elongation factor Elf1